MRISSFLKLTALLLTLCCLQMLAQTTTSGDISGTVTDPSGAVVAGATVTCQSVEYGTTDTTKTSSTGAFRLSSLKPGNYRLSVTQPGFRRVVESAVVAIGQVTTANLQLQIGQSSETVEVSGTAPLIQTENANISTSFTPKQIDLLPNGGNDLSAVAQTAPGVLMNTSSGGGYGNFNAFGLPATANLFTVNGNDENDPYLNLNNSGATNLLLGKNEVSETAVVSNGYTGQYGRQAGAQVDYATKSGTNDWHGNAMYWYNSAGMNGNDWFNNHTNTPLPEEVNNQWAASIGGPIKKDKAFFFIDTEGLRYVLSTSNLAIIPTPAYGAAVASNIIADSVIAGGAFGTAPVTGVSQAFYQNYFNLYQTAPGLNRAQPVNNSIDATGNLGCGDLNVGGNLYPALAKFGGTGANPAYGLPNMGGGTPCANFFRSTVGQQSHEWILAGRLDYNLSNNDKLFGRVRFDRGLQPTYTDIVSPSLFNATSNQPQDEGELNWTHTFSPTVLNQFVASGLYYSAFFVNPNQAAATAAFPYVLIDADTSAFSNLGGAGYDWPQGRNVSQYMFIDDLSILKGSHALKMGVNFRRNDITDGIYGVLTTPEAIDVSQTIQDAGQLFEISQRFPQKLEQPVAISSFGLYFQDEYRVNSALKLTLTLRADRNTNMTCGTNCFTNFVGGDFNGIPHNNSTPWNQYVMTGQNNMVPNLEKVVFQPRFGFAWSPLHKQNTVVRGGIGLFSDLYPGTLADRFNRNPLTSNSFALVLPPFNGGAGSLPFATGEAGSAESTVTLCNTLFTSAFATGSPDSFGANAARPVGCHPPNFNSVTSTLKNPKYLEWNFEIQQAIGSKTSFVLNYVGNHGYDEFILNPWMNSYSGGAGAPSFGGLPVANLTDPTLGSPGCLASGCGFLRAPLGGFANITQLNNQGVSNYDGLTATVTRRFTLGFTGSFNYTWSHSQDMISNGGILPYSGNDSLDIQFNPFCLRCLNYGNADYDVRHNITANYVWELPFKANGMLNKLVSGWSVSGTFFYRTGYPYTVYDSGAQGFLPNTTSVLYPMATFLGGATNSGCNSPTNADGTYFQCLSASQFSDPATAGGFGNTQRNTFRGAPYFNSDFSILKNIPLTERFNFGLGANFFNVFNHANFSNPVPDIASGQFGQIQQTVVPPTSPYGAFVGSAVSGREIQLHARLTF
ncbi:MAG TPA: carboxypeptidase regulatory-like domain-containing protein [Terriglobales bacterium]|nr:carboxypeptidase regulatory-like domain-containing protein [Terriglobales bacterium]